MATKQMQDIRLTELYSDFERNFRDPNHDYASCEPTEGYDHEKFLAGKATQGMFESILYDGIRKPLVVAELSDSESAELSERLGRTVRFRTIQGHRRAKTAENIERLLPGKIETIPAIVYSGLTLNEEWKLLADHGGPSVEEKLSELGEYRACLNLHGTGLFSQEQIANMMGQSRGWVMRKLWISKMGVNTPLEEEFLKRFEPEKYKETGFLKFSYEQVEKLHKMYTTDTENGVDPMADGSEFRKGWDRLKATGGVKPTTPQMMKRADLDARLPLIKGCAPLEEFAKFVKGEGGNAQNAAEMFKRIEAKAEKADDYATANKELSKELESVKAELATALARVAELESELESARATPATTNRQGAVVPTSSKKRRK